MAWRTGVFIDTSVWYAAADSSDAGNPTAKSVLGSGERLLTSDHVLVESWLLIHHRLGPRAAGLFWSGLRSGVATIEPATSADLETAWSIGEEFPDHDFSIVDRTSFAVMRRLGIERVASFDSDFAVYRYGPRRDRAFRVIPS